MHIDRINHGSPQHREAARGREDSWDKEKKAGKPVCGLLNTQASAHDLRGWRKRSSSPEGQGSLWVLHSPTWEQRMWPMCGWSGYGILGCCPVISSAVTRGHFFIAFTDTGRDRETDRQRRGGRERHTHTDTSLSCLVPGIEPTTMWYTGECSN